MTLCRRRDRRPNETDADEEKAWTGERAVTSSSASASVVSAVAEDGGRDGKAIILLVCPCVSFVVLESSQSSRARREAERWDFRVTEPEIHIPEIRTGILIRRNPDAELER